MRYVIAGLAIVTACTPHPATDDTAAPRVQTVRAEGMKGSFRVSGVTDASTTALSTSPVDAFQFLPLAYDSLSIPRTWVEPKQFLVSSQGFKVRARLGKTPLSRYIDCGSTQIGANADSYDVFMTVTSRLTANGAGSTLSTTVEAASRPLSFSQDYSRCSSRGELEKRIGAIVKAALQK